MKHKKFKKLDFFEQCKHLEKYNIQVNLYRCMDGGGEIIEHEIRNTYKTRADLKAQLEIRFLLKKEKNESSK